MRDFFTDEDKNQYDKKVEKIVEEYMKTEKLGLEIWAVKFKLNKKEINFIELKKINI